MDSHQDIAPMLPDGDVGTGQVLGGRYRLIAKRDQRDDISLWDGWDQRLSRDVTIFVIPMNHPRTDALLWAGRQAGPAIDPRFLRVLDVLPAGPSDPQSLIVCEDCAGVSLQTLLRDGPLPSLDAAWVVCEVASALAPMHDAGLSHGAISPASVMVTTSGAVRIKGFLLYAALTGRIDHDPAVRERADVTAIGRLLYAGLTGYWPEGAAAPAQTAGLPPAPWRDNELLSPTQVRPGVSPILDAVCMQTLQPREGAAPLRSATAVALALHHVLGTADPSHDLAAKVASVLALGQSDPATARRHPYEMVGDGAEATSPPTDTAHLDVPPPTDAVSQPVTYDQTEPKQTGSTGYSQVHRTAAVPPAPKPPTPSKPNQWLWHLRWAVPLLVVIILVVWLTRGCSAQTPTPPPAQTTSPSTTAQALTITAVTELDATADGGDGKEHPSQVPYATDGNPETCWTSEQYSANYIPRAKPGIGLIFDLGQLEQLSSLNVTLGTTPNDLSVMVPNDQTVDIPPLDTVGSWTSVLDVTMDTATMSLQLPDATSTRFVMLYFTNLAPVPGKDNKMQASVCEVTAAG